MRWERCPSLEDIFGDVSCKLTDQSSFSTSPEYVKGANAEPRLRKTGYDRAGFKLFPANTGFGTKS